MANTFVIDLQAFVDKAKEAPGEVLRGVSMALLTNIVYRTPVGRPELWARNKVAYNYNTQVRDFNKALRDDPSNLDKRGRLKRGKKLHDGMDIIAPAGYVGGRARANWNVSIGEADTSSTDNTDADGGLTINVGADAIKSAKPTDSIYITNNLPYINVLEYGAHSQQAPNGMVRITIAEVPEFVAATVAGMDK